MAEITPFPRPTRTLTAKGRAGGIADDLRVFISTPQHIPVVPRQLEQLLNLVANYDVIVLALSMAIEEAAKPVDASQLVEGVTEDSVLQMRQRKLHEIMNALRKNMNASFTNFPMKTT